MSVRAAEVARRCRAQIPYLEAELAKLARADSEHDARMREVHKEVRRAWDYFGTVVVPDLVAEHLDWGAQTLGLPMLGSAAVQAAMEAERTQLQETLRNLDSNQTYAGREGLLNAYAIQLEEVGSAMAPLEASVTSCRSLFWFEHLLAVEYGTDQYTGKWYTMSYYRDWKYADEAVAAMREEFGIETFTQLRDKFLEQLNALDQLRTTDTELRANVRAVEVLIEQHAEATRKLDKLPERTLAKLRGVVKEHLHPLPRPEIAKRVARYDAGAIALKRVAGLEAKAEYLQVIHARWVSEPKQAIGKALRKAHRDSVKLLRPKNAYREFSESDVNRRFADPRPKWDARWNRYQQSRDLLWNFEDYGAYDFDGDRPWWSAMTDDRVKARFIPEVGSYYQARASAKTRRRDDENDDLAVVALADQTARSDDDFDDLS